MISAIVLKFEQVVVTGLLLSQRAFRFGSGTSTSVISFGSWTLLPKRLISSVVSGNAGNFFIESISRPSRSKIVPPLAFASANTYCIDCPFFSSSCYYGKSILSQLSVIFVNRSTNWGCDLSVSIASWNLNVHAWSIKNTSLSLDIGFMHINSVLSFVSSTMILATLPMSKSSNDTFWKSLRLNPSGTPILSSWLLWKASHAW